MKKNFLISVLIFVLFLTISSLFIEEELKELTVVATTVTVGNTVATPTAPDINPIKAFTTIMNWVFYGLIVFATLMMIIGGFNFITAGGDADKQGKARDSIIYAIIGIIVAALAKGVATLIENIMRDVGK